MAHEDVTDYLVVGAGLAGLAFAQDIAQTGATVRLLDKGRGVGGRMATRRWAETRVDHGAQYFTARGERLASLTEQGLSEGWLRVWSDGFPLWKDDQITEREPTHPRYIAPSGMSEVAKRLAAGQEITTSATVNKLQRTTEGGYRAECAEGQTFQGRRLILTLPPVQMLAIARDLLPVETVAGLEEVIYFPAWTLLLALEKDIEGAEWPAIEFEGHPVLGWVSRDHTKRAPGAPPVLIVHGSGEWSRAHLEDDPAAVREALLEAVTGVLGPLSVKEAQTHRWRYARVEKPFNQSFFWHPESGIGGCGDWAGGAKVEGALTSGWELAAAVNSL
jgi:renalase